MGDTALIFREAEIQGNLGRQKYEHKENNDKSYSKDKRCNGFG
ncbi:hypothetical protein [Clostridium manihotivorum]|nr:hypothetical protein [Clostridium manihotivorum]